MPRLETRVSRSALARGDYLLGVNGLALLRQWPHGDGNLVARRRTEIARVAASIERAGEGADHFGREELPFDEGYRRWAATYDGPNPLVMLEETSVRPLLDTLPPGDALDAACGTGRYAAYLLARGHRVVGVDGSPEMLAVARGNAVAADLRVGDLAALPLDDASVDLAVCALALTHVRDLRPAFRELARVVRPGGWLVISDPHPFIVSLGGQAFFRDSNGAGAYVRNYAHTHAAYLAAIQAAGLRVQHCLEPPIEEAHLGLGTNGLGAEALDAARDAFIGLPGALIWALRSPPGGDGVCS